MRCGDCREQLSARLDGEDDPALSEAVDAHVASCASCRRWQEDASRVTRLARLTVASATPDVSGAVLARAPRPRRQMLKLALRVALALLAAGQVVLGLAHIEGVLGHAPGTGGVPAHFTHEFAAFTIAVGIGFAWVAWRTARAPGLVPTLTTFVVVLTALEIVDLVRGAVDPSRLASHTLVQAGLVVVLLLSTRRLGGDGFAPRAWRAHRQSEHAVSGDAGEQNESGRGDDGLRPSARHDAA